MFYSVEKIENNEAVLINDDCKKTFVPISNLPNGTIPGSILKNENGIFVLDKNEEKKRREKISSLQKKLFK